MGLIPGLGRSPKEVTRTPLQNSYLENSMDKGAWQATVHGVAKNQTQLSDEHTHISLQPGGKESASNESDPGSISELGRFPGAGNGNPLQYSCLRNPMDRGTWLATVQGVVKEADTT